MNIAAINWVRELDYSTKIIKLHTKCFAMCLQSTMTICGYTVHILYHKFSSQAVQFKTLKSCKIKSGGQHNNIQYVNVNHHQNSHNCTISCMPARH